MGLISEATKQAGWKIYLLDRYSRRAVEKSYVFRFWKHHNKIKIFVKFVREKSF